MIYNQLEFKPKEKEQYYYINFNNNKVSYAFYKTTIPQLYSPEYVLSGISCTTNNCFKTEELAQEYLKMHNEIERLRKEYPVEWENRSEKYYLRYDCVIDEIYVIETCSIAIQGSFYISNEEVLQQFIKEYKSSIKKFIFGIEEKEELYYIKFPMFKDGENYLNVNLDTNDFFLLDNAEEFVNDNKTKWTKEECNKIITDNNLQNFVELEKVEK